MPLQRGTETRAMSGQALVRMAPELAARVDAAATSAGLSTAAWFRRLAVEATAADETLAAPVPRETLPPEDIAELGRLTRHVGRLNGAVVQITAALRDGGQADDHAAAEQVLADLRSSQRELVDLVQEVRNARRRDTR